MTEEQEKKLEELITTRTMKSEDLNYGMFDLMVENYATLLAFRDWVFDKLNSMGMDPENEKDYMMKRADEFYKSQEKDIDSYKKQISSEMLARWANRNYTKDELEAAFKKLTDSLNK